MNNDYLKNKEGVNIVNPSEECDDLCLSIHTESRSDLWYVDSGASLHCTTYRKWFNNHVQSEFGHVTVGNKQEYTRFPM